MIIAIDGPVGSGKRTIALAIARRFRLSYLNTGLFYRAVAFQVRLNGGDLDSESDAVAACAFPTELLSEPELQVEHVGGFASRVAVHAAVRDALFDRQWSFAHREGGSVLDGRDIGTVIAPDADAKLFLTANLDTRVHRIYDEYVRSEYPIQLSELIKDVEARDARDRSRAAAPLRQAEDAIVFDTTAIDDQAMVADAIAIVNDRLSQQAMQGKTTAGI